MELSPSQHTTAKVSTVAQQDKQFKVESDVKAMCISGHTVWLAHNDGSVSIRKTRNAELVHTFQSSHGRAWSMVSALRSTVDYVWIGLSTGIIEVYNAVSREFVVRLHRHTGGIYALTEFGGFIYSASNDFEIMQWHSDGVCFVRQFHGHSNYVRALFAEGSLLISGSDDHSCRVWDVSSGKTVSTYKFHEAGVSALCRVGVTMWSADDLGRIKIWKIATGELIESIQGHVARINALKKVGSRVYSASSDHNIVIWDCMTRREVGKIQAHLGWVISLACPSQLSRYYMWSAAADGCVRCWHHDEYSVMNNDAERFNDMRWYHVQHGPYKELNESLIEQLKSLDSRVEILQKDYTVGTATLLKETQENMRGKVFIRDLEASLLSASVRADEAQKMLESIRDKAQAREEELSGLVGRNTTLTLANAELRCEVERLKHVADECNRRATAAIADKQAADITIAELLKLKTNANGIAPVIISNNVESAREVLLLHRDIVDLSTLNESLREEVIRYKGILGIRTNTDMPSLNFGKRVEAIVNNLIQAPPLPSSAPPQRQSSPTGNTGNVSPSSGSMLKKTTSNLGSGAAYYTSAPAAPSSTPPPSNSSPSSLSAPAPYIVTKMPSPVPQYGSSVYGPPLPAPTPAASILLERRASISNLAAAATASPPNASPVQVSVPYSLPQQILSAAPLPQAVQPSPRPTTPPPAYLSTPYTNSQPSLPAQLGPAVAAAAPAVGSNVITQSVPGFGTTANNNNNAERGGLFTVSVADVKPVKFEDGYSYRGAHWTNANIGSYVQERYFKSPVLFDRLAKTSAGPVKSPRQPSPRLQPQRPMSARTHR